VIFQIPLEFAFSSPDSSPAPAQGNACERRQRHRPRPAALTHNVQPLVIMGIALDRAQRRTNQFTGAQAG